jgi:hypothetical protein
VVTSLLPQALGVLAQAAGLLLLFLHWRARRGLGGAALAAGWALILAGAAPWFVNAAPERALALAALAPMALGLLFLAPDALPRIANGAAKPARAEPVADLDAETPAPGRVSRNIARWVAGIVAAPALALAAAAAWQAFTPGATAGQIVVSTLVTIAAWTAAALWLLSTAKPWRATLIAVVLAAAIGGATYVKVAGGLS